MDPQHHPLQPESALDPLEQAVLVELLNEVDGISLPRLTKRLGIRMSVLLRTLAWLGEDSIGGQPGRGWTRVEERGDRSFAMLTEAGRRAVR